MEEGTAKRVEVSAGETKHPVDVGDEWLGVGWLSPPRLSHWV